MKSGKDRSKTAFQAVNLDVQCRMPLVSHPSFEDFFSNISIVTFIKVSNDLDPVQIVHAICRGAQSNSDRRATRWIKRMTPVTCVRKVLGGGLEEVAREVLGPHFHSEDASKKVTLPSNRVRSGIS